MKPSNITDDKHIDSIKKVNDKDAKFKVGDNARISKYKYIFTNG